MKVPTEIRPFDVRYRVVNKDGQPLALNNGASVFDLPFLAKKAINKEFRRNDPNFDIENCVIEEVAVINLEKFQAYFEGLKNE